MRSWFTAMPGESVSCAGCHEPADAPPLVVSSRASASTPQRIEPWLGPPRGFDFEVEIQPVLDRYCVGCHDGDGGNVKLGLSRKSEDEIAVINRAYHKVTDSSIKTVLTPSFIALHPYVRRPHAESNVRLQVPAEFAADASPLVQLLEKGHHNVWLDDEAWRRIYTWIDLGAPDHGSWQFSEWGVKENYYERRLEEYRECAARSVDVEQIPPVPPAPEYLAPAPEPARPPVPQAPKGWPFDRKTARTLQQQVGLPVEMQIRIADDVELDFVLIPAGSFIMGQVGGPPDEHPRGVNVIEKPFYLSKREISNREFQVLVDPDHFSGFESWRSIDWRGEGYPLHEPRQPVVRVSWPQAQAFCRALTVRTGRRVELPSEAEWEWACRAGTGTPLWYGTIEDDFSGCENLAGAERKQMAFRGKRKWYLRDDRYADGQLVSAPCGSLPPNPWGLQDMHGNVAEWTRTAYMPKLSPVPPDAELDSPAAEIVVRGGSWDHRPVRARSASRWKYPAWRKVYNVGFRVVMRPDGIRNAEE
jgi:formylglycine-generating enzyme required for sulfatase activity